MSFIFEQGGSITKQAVFSADDVTRTMGLCYHPGNSSCRLLSARSRFGEHAGKIVEHLRHAMPKMFPRACVPVSSGMEIKSPKEEIAKTVFIALVALAIRFPQ